MGRVIGVIPARAGSERLPGKNLKPLAGKPMIAWTLEAARGAASLDRLAVTTDDAAAIGLAEAMGVACVRRPDALAGPRASVIDAIEHALGEAGEAFDLVVLLQPTSPLRTAADIDGAVALARQSGAPVIGVSRLPKPASFYGAVGGAGAFEAAPAGAEALAVINGAVYVARPDDLFRARTFRMPGAVAWEMPPERSWDVDSAADFAVCEALMELRA
jgi:CMP-N,N'-diacetyllegionaminic acid synthase